MSILNIQLFLIHLILELGGLTGITIFILKFLGNTLADRLSTKYEFQLNKKLELYKSGIENGNYVSKTQFDANYACRREISEALTACFDAVKTITPIDGGGIQESMDVSEIKKIIDNLKSVLNSNVLILDEGIYNNLLSLINIFETQISSYISLTADTDDYELDFISREELSSKENFVYNTLRQYFNSLQIKPDIL